MTDDESGRVSGDPSETSSVAHSMDGEEDWIWGGEGPSYVDVQEIRAQLAFNGSLQALREIRSVVFGVSWVFHPFPLSLTNSGVLTSVRIRPNLS